MKICALWLPLFLAVIAFPTMARPTPLPRLAPPTRIWLEPFASTPIPVEYPLSPEAQELMNRLAQNTQITGTILTSAHDATVVGMYSDTRWVNLGDECIATRKGCYTGRFIVYAIDDEGLHLECTYNRGLALGDRIIMLSSFATVTPRVCWTPVPTATGYRVERHRRYSHTREIIYEGTATCCPDPVLREALGTNKVYEYRVIVLRGAERPVYSRSVNNVIKETPLRAIIAACHPELRPGSPAYAEALLDALQHHPDPAMRLCAAWELGQQGGNRTGQPRF